MLARFAHYIAVAGLVSIVAWVFLWTPGYAQQPTATPPVISLDDESALESLAASGTPIELVEQRTATAKHYQLGPALYRASISSVPIHYRDAAGTWQNADTRPMAASTGGYEVVKSDVKLFFPPTLASGLTIDALVDLPDPNTAVVSAVTDANGKPDFSAIPADVAVANIQPQPAPVQLLFQWQPQGFHEAAATATASSVTYDTLTFYPTTTGFKQVIDQPTAPYIVRMTLPPDTTLHNAAGQMQPGSFSSASFSLRTLDGVPLLFFSAPVALASDVTATTIPYTVERQGDAIIIVATAPASTQQLIAEVVTPFQLLNLQSPTTVADWIWGCQPTTTNITTDTLRVGTRFDTGCTNGVERALVQWDISSIPITANLAIPDRPGLSPAIVGDISTSLYHLPEQSTGGGNVNIGLYRYQVDWNPNEVTWISRTNTVTWTEQGGGSIDYNLSEEVTVTVNSTISGYVNMGSIHDLMGAWRTNQIMFDASLCDPANCFGVPNYGVLYRSIDESTNTNLDRVFASGSMTSTAPLLSIDYISLPYAPPTNDEFRIPRTPGPDAYRAEIPQNSWQAMAIRPNEENRADYDMVVTLERDATTIVEAFTPGTIALFSSQSGVSADVVMLNNRVDSLVPVRIWVYPIQGTGHYDVRQVTVESTLIAGSNVVTPVILSDTLIKLYDIDLATGVAYEFSLQNINGNADLSLAIFGPPPDGIISGINLAGSLAQANNGSFGDAETFVYTAQTTGRHALLVLNNGNGNTFTSQFQLAVNIIPRLLYMPATLRNDPPPPAITNGDFEMGLDANWNATNPGGVLVASAAMPGTTSPAPDTSCFGGGMAGQLGTPTAPTNDLRNIPVDQTVIIAQTIDVPADAQTLKFNYKILSYDLVTNSKGETFDYFSVTINDTEVLRDGNPAGSIGNNNPLLLWRSGCKQSTIDITAYAGQTITIRFQVTNGTFPDLNTWAFVDDVVIE